jgi:hypothetical protein
MAITQAMCTSFKVELLTGTHDFTNSTGNTFKMALYTNAATLDATTTAYTASNEVANGNGYTTAGETLTNVTPTSSSTTAYTDFADVTWTTASFTARGALIYNDTASGDPAVCVLDFGADYTATNGDFTVQFPTANATDAIIRIA